MVIFNQFNFGIDESVPLSMSVKSVIQLKAKKWKQKLKAPVLASMLVNNYVIKL